jgi:hypothetical protein
MIRITHTHVETTSIIKISVYYESSKALSKPLVSSCHPCGVRSIYNCTADVTRLLSVVSKGALLSFLAELFPSPAT